MVCKWLVKQLQEDFTDCKDALQSGGYFFVHCLRNNLSGGQRVTASSKLHMCMAILDLLT